MKISESTKLERPDIITAISHIAIASAVTAVGFLLTAPIPLIPGAIHWRVLAFLPCLFGVIYGPLTGFFAGAIGNTLWAIIGGYFNPATPIFDLVGVGITGLLPGLLCKPDDALSNKGIIKIAIVSFVSGVIMVPIVAIGFDLVGVAPFIPAVILLSLSDLPPILVGTPLAAKIIIPPLMKRGMIRWRL